MSALQMDLDAAVVAHRDRPTQETLEALMQAAEAVRADFWRREREEALAEAINGPVRHRSQW